MIFTSTAAQASVSPPPAGSRRISLARWLLDILTVWGLPAFLLWWGLGQFGQVLLQRAARAEFERLEREVESLAQRSDPRVFFQKHLARLFSSLHGMPVRREVLEAVVKGFQKEWPAGLIDLTLYDVEGTMLPVGDPPPEMQLLFDLARAPWTVPLELSPRANAQLLRVVPSPQALLKVLKGRPNRVLALGGSRRHTWGFYDMRPAQGNRVGGVLAFLHQEALPPDLILRRVLSEGATNELGFLIEDGAALLPSALTGLTREEILTRYHLEPTGQFELGGRLVVVKRLDQATLLLAGAPCPTLGWPGPVAVFVVYLLGSLGLLRRSYRARVLGEPLSITLRAKLVGYFAVSFALPLVAVGFLIWAFLEDLREAALDRLRQEQFRRLSEVDRGFAGFLDRQCRQYRHLIAIWRQNVASPAFLIAEAERGHAELRWDNLHLVASTGELLVTQRTTPAEMRRSFALPYAQRKLLFQSWVERGAALPARDILCMTMEHPVDLGPWPEAERFYAMIRRAAAQAGQLALEQYNRVHGRGGERQRTASQLALETVMESESIGLLDAARRGLGTFVPIEGNRELGLIFGDVLPGPGGEGWYAAFIFNNLIHLERMYLEEFFGGADRPTSETPVWEGEPWDFRAASLHHTAPNFPTMNEFRKFLDLFALMEASPRPLARVMSLDGREVEVCALTTSFLKHYLLVGVIDLEAFEARQTRFERKVWGLFGCLAGFGLALSWLLVRRFLLPVRDLTEGLAAIRAKDFDWRLPVRSDDELGRLGQAFNEAIATLRDLEIAHAVQVELLPQKSQRFGAYEVSGVNIMTQAVGGDYFDFIPLPHGLVAIVMGDVSGHGVSAALITAMAKAAFSILCQRFPDRPEEVLARVNRELLTQVKRAKMMTCFLGILDPQSDRIICANAGQSYPFLIGSGGPAEMVRLPSTPLGVSRKFTCSREVIALAGRTFILYSDGLVEAVNERGQMFGYDALTRAVEQAIASRQEDVVGQVLARVRAFTGAVPWGDDATLVVIRPLLTH